jgi:DNA-binding transcriptional regulator PaaX
VPKNKSKRNISRTILKGILYAGGFYIACSSPRFARKALPMIFQELKYHLKNKKAEKSFHRSFYYLLRRRLINIEYSGKQMHVSLTKEGKKLARKCRIDDLAIPKPKKWDGSWRILIFDIPDRHKIKREALRGKLKELGFFQLQKSVWIYPHNFLAEAKVIREFFGLSKSEMQIILANAIENDREARQFFKLDHANKTKPSL